jgi:hypothetical protein
MLFFKFIFLIFTKKYEFEKKMIFFDLEKQKNI